uniref:transmembrane protein 119b n=1 Tax=Doryrhamphus excisus TaxID=161450 RepID=UPI0025AE0A2C|nr:transmembrane protein 119b [Doryrhamphus excisus]
MKLLHVITVSAVYISSGLASPLTSYSSAEGSTDLEDLYVTFSVPTKSASSDYYQTTSTGPAHQEEEYLRKVVDFLEDNMLLILVLASLLFLIFLVACGAIVLSRRRRVNAYYPSSFPSKMYVDQMDKTGGARVFHELPEKAAPRQEIQPVDSHLQLQADIMKAAKNLRSPTKTGEVASIPQDKPDGDVILDEKEPPSPAEEKETCEAAAAAGVNLTSSVGQEDKSQVSVRSLRPASLHLHNDSATLQLIAGEKTAF